MHSGEVCWTVARCGAVLRLGTMTLGLWCVDVDEAVDNGDKGCVELGCS